MDIEKFAKNASFGVPLDKMHEFLMLETAKQDEFLGQTPDKPVLIGNLKPKDIGIPF